MGTQYGAMVHGRRSDKDVASTVEVGTIEGGRIVALVALQGDLASPSLESLKAAFARITGLTDGVAMKLAAAAPPPPYASGVGVVLLFGDLVHVASTGAARCYRERGGSLEHLATGVHDVKPGDAFIAASHASLQVGRAFFTTQIQATSDTEFRNDRLDAALESALAPYSTFIAVAAAHIA